MSEPPDKLGSSKAECIRADLVAGLTVALMGLPVAMAYALIAGVPPRYGLYAAIVPPIVAGLFGSSRYLISGPTNATALLTFSLIEPYLRSARTADQIAAEVLPIVYTLAALSGAILLGAGLLRLGRVIRYVSQSVLTGFLAAAGVLIIIGQLRHLLGVEPLENHFSAMIPGAMHRLAGTLAAVGQTNGYAGGVALGSLVLMWTLRRLDRRLPAALITLVAAGVAVVLLGWDQGQLQLIRDIGRIPASLPPLSKPILHPQAWAEHLSGGAALALLGVVESLAVAKGMAARSGQRVDVDRELVGQGLARIAAGFTGGIVPSGSPTRSAINFMAGARTRLAQISSGVFTAIIVLLLAQPASYIPVAALAAVVVYSATGLIDLPLIRRIVAGTRSDALVLAATFLAAMLLRLDQAIYAGALLSLLMALRQTSQLVVSEMVMGQDGHFREREPDPQTGTTAIVLLQLEGSLYFGAADELEACLRQIARRRPAVVILRLKRAHHLDTTVTERLRQLATELRQQGISLLLCGLRPEVVDLLARTGLTEIIGEDQLFLTDRDIFGSVRRALALGRKLARESGKRPTIREEPSGGLDFVI